MRRARLIRNRVIGLVRRLRARVDQVRPPHAAALDFTAVHRRIELLLGAMYGPAVATGVMAREPGKQPSGRSIVLPRSIAEPGDAAERYRLLAIEQGARIVRGTRLAAPADPMERDIYMIVEGAAVDASLIERAPGLAKAIGRLRREELDRRSRFFVGPASVPVENLLRQLLATDPAATTTAIPRTASAEESAGVARRLAREIRLGMKGRAQYASIQGVALWDDAKASASAQQPEMLPGSDSDSTDTRQSGDGYGGRSSEGASDVAVNDGKSDAPREDGTPNESASANEANANAEASQSTASRGGAASTGEAGPQSHDDMIASDGDAEAVSGAARPKPGGIQYPEWVDRFKRLEPRHTTVYSTDAAEGDGAWARDALREHAAMVRQLRDRFSLLRARRGCIRSASRSIPRKPITCRTCSAMGGTGSWPIHESCRGP
jgi:nitric oxide reductase NorD protein